MRLRLPLICALLVAQAGLTACSQDYVFHQTEPPDKQVQKLFLELEQKHKRSMHLHGFSVHYSVQAPKTIIIRLRYPKYSQVREKALKTMWAAQKFVHHLAEQRYNILGLQTRTEVEEFESES